ncbi:transposase [Chryseobacterium sp. SN22]|uniref:transposase n=1 Tax=Chryseobacterium sp. SN22 TaxID=2606431 RepID=UPI0011F084F2|nr:transposase [Chryseobacterium sp. SN22]KAA0128542.1 transposase [Chryseobacterium sp. SN22]
MNFKTIHIGNFIEKRVAESGIDLSRICNFMKCTEEEIQSTYASKEISTERLLKWSKLLDYDFFRIYTQHLILYSPPLHIKEEIQTKTQLPVFRKNIYTREIIDFILELINNGIKTKAEIIQEYRIPKTTLYKWISKKDKKTL